MTKSGYPGFIMFVIVACSLVKWLAASLLSAYVPGNQEAELSSRTFSPESAYHSLPRHATRGRFVNAPLFILTVLSAGATEFTAVALSRVFSSHFGPPSFLFV